MRILSIFGTRPEAIKMAPLVKAMNSEPDIESVLCVTGQHRQMLDQVLNIFDLKPDYDLAIMRSEQTLSNITTSVINKLEPVLDEVRPNVVLVHGDTTTSMAAALSAFYKQIPIGHVEAGLRTYDRYSPFPEEMNRKLISNLATFHFAPTERNQAALEREGILEKVWVTGNTVLDSFAFTLKDDYRFKEESLESIDFSKPVILLTAHRRENLGEPLRNICHAVKALCNAHPECAVVYPVHLNPIVQKMVYEVLSDSPNVLLTKPIDVLDMHNLMARSSFVMTDSGGLQEEAPFLNKPVLVLRRETEREEVIDSGAAILTGTSQDTIIAQASRLIVNTAHYQSMASALCPYGDGKASERIVGHLLNTKE